MSEKLSCHIVKDLLPLEADGLTGEETSRDIKEHLESCEDCRRTFEAMTGAGQSIQQEQKVRDDVQIDYLKKVRKRGKKAALIVGCVALAILAVFFIRIFVVGSVEKDAIVDVQVTDGRHVAAEAQTFGSATAISKISFDEKDGIVTISVRSSLVGIRRNTVKSAEFTASSEIKQVVDAMGRVLWEDGIPIDSYVSAMFSKKVRYVGDASAVSGLLGLPIWHRYPESGMQSLPYEGGMELQTASEPYGIIIDLKAGEHGLSDADLVGLIITAKKHACLILALVDNLGYMQYRIETGRRINSGECLVITQSITADEALELAQGLAVTLPDDNESAQAVLAAESIKDFAKSASALQRLADVLSKGIFKDVEISW